MEEMENKEKPREEIFSKTVRAGRRTYFFDVKNTKQNEFYITITESKKLFSGEEGKFHYEKHKVFLYREDFEKFVDGLSQVITFISNEKPLTPAETVDENPCNEFSEVTFEDLKETTERSEENLS